LGGESKEAILSSPLLERVVKRGYDVILMTEPVDEYVIQFFSKFDEKFKLVNLGKDGNFLSFFQSTTTVHSFVYSLICLLLTLESTQPFLKFIFSVDVFTE
jgi:hypothetical protein